MFNNIWIATVVTFLVAVGWLRLCDLLAHKGIISSQISRKVIHIGTGPVFVLCWLLYPEEPAARFLAALVPLLITIQFFLVGIGVWKDPAAVTAMSRTGDRKEILRGPLFYGIAFVAITLGLWKTHPAGIAALMILCGGDGLADLVGKKFGSYPIPWSRKKTIEGSLGVFLGGLAFSVFTLLIFTGVGVFPISLINLFLNLCILSMVATMVESLPFRDIDNLSIPVVVVLIGLLIF